MLDQLALALPGGAAAKPYSGHATRQSLKVHSLVSVSNTQASYDAVIDKFPV